MQAIADHRGISIGEMKVTFTRLYGGRVSLREYANGDCIFLDGASRRCSIYPVRPAQCRTWPFWNSNLESPEAWREAQSGCPGMGRGDLVPLVTILEKAAVIDI